MEVLVPKGKGKAYPGCAWKWVEFDWRKWSHWRCVFCFQVWR